METAHLNQLIELEESYWWHVAKRRWATDLLLRYAPPPSSIVEGGIGAAGNLMSWQSLGYKVAGLDCMPESIANAEHRGLQSVAQHDLHNPWPIEEKSSAAVVLLDVLEHLADPVVALRHASDCLSENGKIIFTVPAYPWLFSDWDVRLGHYRRYTTSMLRQQAQEAGLKVVQLSHWNAFTLPIASFLRLIRKLFPSKKGTEFPKVSQWMNRSLLGLASTEQSLAMHVNIPFGLSLVGVLSK